MEGKTFGRGNKPQNISMFTSEHMNTVLTMEFGTAKRYLADIVMNSSALPRNKQIALKMIHGAKNVQALAYGVANFMLASEGLSTQQ